MSNPNPSPENRFQPGQSGNPSGRPKGGLKDYDRIRFQSMTDEQKEEFLSKISPEIRYKMAEGNPKQDSELGGQVKIINITMPPEVGKAYNINATNAEAIGSNSQ